ncbi:hypothetical protein BGY98DRAFT_38415 [Russula aff. rugulosa BPL654]|nr:hypothetical protein BGY98DRAFT_38415 [Russula aff. rugulosa BPL654]
MNTNAGAAGIITTTIDVPPVLVPLTLAPVPLSVSISIHSALALTLTLASPFSPSVALSLPFASRSWERLGEREYDYEFHSGANSASSRGGRGGGDWHHHHGPRLNSAVIGPIGPIVPIGPGVPTGPAAGNHHLYPPPGSGMVPGGFGRGLGRGSPAPIGHAPRKFDFTRERARREREYHVYRERKTSAGGPIGGGGAGGGPVS